MTVEKQEQTPQKDIGNLHETEIKSEKENKLEKRNDWEGCVSQPREEWIAPIVESKPAKEAEFAFESGNEQAHHSLQKKKVGCH